MTSGAPSAVGDGASGEVWAAGGVVYRRGRHGLEIVLVARPREGLWALPKGKPQDGETIEQTALREVREETGLEVRIDERGMIGSIEYTYLDRGREERVHKVVHHFLMQAHGGDVAAHDHEHEVVGWYDVHEAGKRMTYANERAIVEQAHAALAGEGASA